ncbi:DUF1801 domain-containing protein [Rhizobium sp. XQZ8]|uniref:DUF1801 domain-containing protein n=1 Tax=Rhizobium populisoli TaxID=2859785 RepID=UPI001C681602|nr:DUF1801 domain-containing protein [Rhizobium populisoli]MBW6420004.1 DUF1801 domain-containing protein [Rhizobium populisoli]
MTSTLVPGHINETLERYAEPVRIRLLEIRDLILTTAAQTEGVGVLTETLKWGEPAYLTEASGSGTTIRLGTIKSAPDACAVLFNCKTTLVDTFRAQFSEEFVFDGNRALLVPTTGALPREALALCLHAALTYHRRKLAA